MIEMSVDTPIFLSENEHTQVKIPLSLPISFTENDNVKITLPITLPLSFTNGKRVTLPITLPMTFNKDISNERVSKSIKIFEYVDLVKKHNSKNIPFKEYAVGKSVKIPFKEKAWNFPGLVLSENVITHVSKQINIVENVQALILVDFELLSSNEIKMTWYGSNVPNLTVMKKALSDDIYTVDKSYSWGTGSCTLKITDEDYNIYLLGNSNSGTSSIYTISGINENLVIPEVQVLLNDKIYTNTIDYTATYRITINY